MIKKIAYLIALLTLSTNLFASHLVGGSLGYEYLGKFGQNYRYKIILTVYNNCDAFSQIPLPVATQPVAVYNHDVSATTPMLGGNKSLVTNLNLNLVDSFKVEPPTSSNCAIGQAVCIYKGVYEATVDLPLSFTGYHLYFTNFARNASITNLLTPGATAMSFHAYIPPTLVNNSSPVFSDDPVPFLCINDTVSILNTAIDPDGDQLIFSFVTPMADAGGPFPPTPLTWPITQISYNPGYNVVQPFGATGYSFINGATGLTQYMSPTLGNFVVAVEIKEIRNGNVIGITRRDLQLLVINCPPNPAPNLSATGGSGITQYTIKECDTLSFPIIFVDANGDSLKLTTSGQIFDSLFVNPPATIDSLVLGDSTVTANFNWQSSCGTAQALPYLFTVSVTDNGCPPKTTNVVYQVTVVPPTAPDSISGPPLICQNSNGTYSVPPIPGYTFNWTVTNGSINSGQGSNSINVNWPNVGSGTLSVNAISNCGCPSAIIDTVVTIIPAPNADAGNDTNLCLGDSIQIGGVPTGPPGTTFSWSPSTNMNDSTFANPLIWPSTTTTYVVSVDNGFCVSLDTVVITVGSANIDAGNDTSICINDSTQLNATGGISYLWTPNIGLNNDTIFNPIAKPLNTTIYTVTVSDSLGCTGSDSVIITVTPTPTLTLTSDTTICNGDCIQLQVLGGNSFTWTPATGLSNDTIFNPLACPIVTTNYIVSVNDSNSCNNIDSVLITVNPTPSVVANNDTSICINSCVQLMASGANSYLWTPSTGLSNDTIANPLACPLVTTTYIVTGTDTSGCFSSDTVTITVNSLPIVDAGPNQGICVIGSAVIGGAPTGPVGSSYIWTPNATLNNDTIANPTASPLITTTYTVMVIDTNGCINSDIVIVSINPLPIVNAGPDTSVCEGGSIIIGGTPTGPSGSTFSWSPAGTLNNSSLANPTASPIITTQYIVTVTDSNNCINIDTMLLTVNPLPIITTSNDTAICLGSCAQLTATGGTSYVWTPATGLSNDTIANPIACPLVTTTYLVTATNINNCSDTASITVTINPPPIVDAGLDKAICIGDSSLIGGSPTGPVGSSYIWTPNTTLNDDTLANPTAKPIITTTYYVTVTDSNGCVSIDSTIITVNPLPIIDAGLDTSICIGDAIIIGGNPTGPLGSSYVWTPNANLNDDTLANPTASPIITTQYIVTVTDSNNCINMDTMLLTVNPLPIITTSNDTSICAGDCAQLLASGGSSYLWAPATGLSNDTIANPIACPTVPTTYIVTITNGNNCTDTASVTININPLPVINAGPDLWLCAGDSTQLNASGGISYLWTPSLGLNDTTISNPIAFPQDTSIYIVRGFDSNGCSNIDSIQIIVNDEVPIESGLDTTICFGDTVMLGGNPTSPIGTSYQWFPNGGTLNNDTLANPLAFPKVTTTYYVIATNDTCTAIDSVTITVNPPPNANAGLDVNLCIGDSVQLIASGGNNYLWNPGLFLTDSTIFNPIAYPIDTTEYIVVVTDTNGCSAFDSVIVNVNPLPNISAGAGMTVCSGDSVQLIATGGVSYVWTPSTGLSSDTIPNPMASPTTNTVYYVVGTDILGCSNIDSVLVTINLLIVPDLRDTTICIGEALQLTVNGPSGATYLWTPSTDLSSTTIFNPITTTQVTITYNVLVTDTNGCTDTTSILITAQNKPIAGVTIDASPSCAGVLAEFTNTSSGAVSYLWDFGDGEQSTEINPSHIFAYGTSSVIILTSYTSGLCSDTSSYPIVTANFEDYFNLTPPTVLTPNGDGVNDLFQLDVPGSVSECTNIKVFNRWGMLMFESKGQNIGWDGRTTAAAKVPVGTYFYIIEINGITKKGSLTILE